MNAQEEKALLAHFHKSSKPMSRRAALRAAGCGFGLLGLSDLLRAADGTSNAGDQNPLAPKPPHFKARAKRVIFLFMHGGVSHVDSFDYKPRLIKDNGKPLPIKRPLAFADTPPGPLVAPLWNFKQRGQSGLWVSDLFPQMASVADDLCVIRSMVGEGVDHGAALLQTFTGMSNVVRPSMGSWVTYGLGSENRDLPGYVMIKPALSHGGSKNWSSAFLPGAYQGTAIGHAGMRVDDIKGEPIEYLKQKNFSSEEQRFELDMLKGVNRKHQEMRQHDPALEARIQSFELAFRMQTKAPEAFEVERESEATKKLYGLDNPKTADFGWQCLLARRLAERGVRYIQCTHSYKWDQHSDILQKHPDNAAEVDLPIAGLIKDLKSRGMLEDTLVIWAGEFGRTPISEVAAKAGERFGRDHNPYGYSIWMAGGGVKPGFAYGSTDDIGYHAVEDRMHIHDFHATVLALMGLDHLKLTFRNGGRDFRLTDVAGVVADKIFV